MADRRRVLALGVAALLAAGARALECPNIEMPKIKPAKLRGTWHLTASTDNRDICREINLHERSGGPFLDFGNSISSQAGDFRAQGADTGGSAVYGGFMKTDYKTYVLQYACEARQEAFKVILITKTGAYTRAIDEMLIEESKKKDVYGKDIAKALKTLKLAYGGKCKDKSVQNPDPVATACPSVAPPAGFKHFNFAKFDWRVSMFFDTERSNWVSREVTKGLCSKIKYSFLNGNKLTRKVTPVGDPGTPPIQTSQVDMVLKNPGQFEGQYAFSPLLRPRQQTTETVVATDYKSYALVHHCSSQAGLEGYSYSTRPQSGLLLLTRKFAITKDVQAKIKEEKANFEGTEIGTMIGKLRLAKDWKCTTTDSVEHCDYVFSTRCGKL